MTEPSRKNSPSLSIIIPVLHEEKNINGTLGRLLQQPGIEDAEILVVEGDPAQGTLHAIQERYRDRIQLLHASKGRASQMNTGASHARGEVLLFHHADTVLPPGAVLKIQRTIEVGQPRISGGAFTLRIDTSHPLLRLAAWGSTVRSRITRVPFGDQNIFLRAEVFRDLDGYRMLPLMEEVDLMQRLRKAGYTIRIFKESVVASARRWERDGTWANTFKDMALLTLYYLGVPPHRLKPYYPDP